MHTEMQFPNRKYYEMDLAGRKFSIETGKMAGLSNASCLVRYGDTVVLVNVTASEKPREGIDFFPLSVDFEEKLYAVGRIPGSFMRREGRPGDKAILTSRVIDRPIRPLFPKDMRNDVVVSAVVMSVEQDNEPEVAALIGVSTALSISDIPWNGPLAGVHVGLIDGQFRQNLEETGMGYELEVDMIRTAHELDLLTCPYVFTPDEARAMAEAGADMLVPHMGLTTKGSIGAATAKTLDECVDLIQAMRDAATAVNPDVIVLCHGGPIAEPEDAMYVLERTTGVVGFFGASSMERLPTELAITENMRRFKALHVSKL
jgi:ribonuclease PH